MGPVPDNAKKLIEEIPDVRISKEDFNLIILSGKADAIREVKLKLTGWLSFPVNKVKIPSVSAGLHKIKRI